MDYKVETEYFQGPLDLLLTLIEERKLEVTQVSLAEITDAYVAHIQSSQMISLAHMADFLAVAAKLILIKSRALLPLLQLEEDEEEDLFELERQLAALKVIKDIIPEFMEAFVAPRPQYARIGMWGVEPSFLPDQSVTGERLQVAFRASVEAIPELDPIEEKIIADIVSLEQKIIHVQTMVRDRAEIAFSKMVSEKAPPQEVVVSFLALLELVKQKIITVAQYEIGEEIMCKKIAS